MTNTRPVSLGSLFVAFMNLALQGFGGVLAVSERVLCNDRRWLTREQFLETLAVAQVLPGPNICNLAVMVGDRFHGWRGAVTALMGMMLVPLGIVLGFTALYARFAEIPAVAGALKGMGAVAAGMILGTAIRLVTGLRDNVLGGPLCVAAAAAAFIGVAIVRWPLAWVLGLLGVTCTLWAAYRLAATHDESGA